ncbi:MAG: hypothetical protein N4A33_01765 [Bacteriovoracaceae bacterium]|nr:hypothetical protein [Bacteriovoracaceae bacterium]
MKKLLIGLLALGAMSSFAGINELAVKIEAKKCKRQLLNYYRGADFYPDIRNLGHIDTYPLTHIFAVYEPQRAEPTEVVKMVKHKGSKCAKD